MKNIFKTPHFKLSVFVLMMGVLLCSIYIIKHNPAPQFFTKAASVNPSPVRGQAGDLWADTVIGKRDITEIGVREVVGDKVYNPGGVIVDRSVSPGRAYVWDSGNNRVLGVDLAKCYAQKSSDPNSRCAPDLVIGQPTGNDYGACNLDSSFQTYPNRPPASASTLCGMREDTHTTLEDGSHSNMYIDNQGTLYVADYFNHRILKYINPFTTDTVADEVWGQPNFTSDGCNITGRAIGGGNADIPAPKPTASSLCFASVVNGGSGVAFDTNGNMWVDDGGNNRILRFPKQTDGSIAKTADLVLGQPDFTTGGDWSGGSALNQFNSPDGIRFDSQNNLYVNDAGNNRILKFTSPFTSNMTGTIFANGSFTGVENDPQNRGVWTTGIVNWNSVITLWGWDGTNMKTVTGVNAKSLGSFGFDSDGNIVVSVTSNGQDVYRLKHNTNDTYSLDYAFYSPPAGFNIASPRRLDHPAWAGVTTTSNQLIVADGRLRFWNNLQNLTNGQPEDGFVGATDFNTIPGYNYVRSDAADRVWTTKGSAIEIYQGPLTQGATPIGTIPLILNVLGGGTIQLKNVLSVQPTADGKFAWLSDTQHDDPNNLSSRVVRVRDPLTNPVVDVVLGQKNLTDSKCNRGEILEPSSNQGRPPSQDAALDMICYASSLAIDKLGNLYVADHSIESAGNWRVLMFAPTLFPNDTASVIFAPPATKEFPRRWTTVQQTTELQNPYFHESYIGAFDSKNHMVTGNNAYSSRWTDYYLDPAKVNPVNPRDPQFAMPDGKLNDYYGWGTAATFDTQDNLYVLDANRGQVRIYKQPFYPAITPTTSMPSPTNIPTGTPTNTPIPQPTFTPAPTIVLPPIITVDTPLNNTVYVKGSSLVARYSCSDPNNIPVTSCVGAVANNTSINTSSTGAKKFTVNAANSAGKKTSLTINYIIGYAINYISPTVELPNVNNIALPVSYIAAKWKMTTAQGQAITASGTVTAIKYTTMSCGGAIPAWSNTYKTANGYLNGKSRYDIFQQLWVFNWQPPQTKGCYALLFQLNTSQVFTLLYRLN